MTRHKSLDRRNSLRTHAEGMVRKLRTPHKAKDDEALTHELLVHKVELEIQNEELRRAQLVIEEARDRYLDLYEFAPVAYLTLNAKGTIDSINMTGAMLLGMDRAKLVNRRFSAFVGDVDQDRWYRIFTSLLKSIVTYEKTHKVGLTVMRHDRSFFHAFLNCTVKKTPDAPPLLRIALMDISAD